MNEFSIIDKYFKPLSVNFAGSLHLSDDAAILTPPKNCELVISTDALSQGIHFIGTETPAQIASKALRVNLSDLAAMGAEPICYFLTLILPCDTTEEWLENFANGLKQTQEEFNITLAGGDTTAINGNLSISITAIGSVPNGKALRRNGAKIGDDIYVSGTLGDSILGLELLQSTPSLTFPISEQNNFSISRYLTPQPRIKLGMNLRNIANSAMDVSDGLLQDLEHICTASNVGATIYADKIPITNTNSSSIDDVTLATRRGNTAFGSASDTDSQANQYNNHQLIAPLTGGDDYELLFTASPNKKFIIKKLSKSLQLPLTYIGKITAGNDVQTLNQSGEVIKLNKKGFSHF